MTCTNLKRRFVSFDTVDTVRTLGEIRALKEVSRKTRKKEAASGMSELIDKLAKLNPEAALVEPREFFDVAIVDITDHPVDSWPRKREPGSCGWRSTMSSSALRRSCQWLECEEDEALDWYCYNTIGAWMGEGTPTFQANYGKDGEPILDS